MDPIERTVPRKRRSLKSQMYSIGRKIKNRFTPRRSGSSSVKRPSLKSRMYAVGRKIGSIGGRLKAKFTPRSKRNKRNKSAQQKSAERKLLSALGRQKSIDPVWAKRYQTVAEKLMGTHPWVFETLARYPNYNSFDKAAVFGSGTLAEKAMDVLYMYDLQAWAKQVFYAESRIEKK